MELRAGPKCQQPESPCLLVGQLFVGELKTGPHVQVTDAKLGQPPAPIRQSPRELGDRPVGTSSQPGTGDPQRQWQPTTQPRHFECRRPLGLDRLWSDDLAQQLQCLLRVEDVQQQRLGA